MRVKKFFVLILSLFVAVSLYGQTKYSVQVINQETVNLSASEAAWLPGQVQDKLKSNLQEYLEMKTVVDSKSEKALKKLQAESEGDGRDETTAIELGKITTAKFALFTKIRKTANGYTISADFTDLTTGEQMASVTSKEYSKAEYLYGSTGAVDEITLKLSEKLNIKLSDLNKNLLTSGSANFSLDDQLALAKQNEEQFNKMMSDYDAELSKLMTSNDINAVQNKKRIEAEKALLQEKQNAEKKRQEELAEQKARAAEDEKLENERSIALKTQRDQMAKDAAEKAAEVRKLKTEKQGVLAFITTLESKKKALVEIRQEVEERSVELHNQMKDDEVEQAIKILEANWASVELKDGKPTEAAKQRRANKVFANYDALLAKFIADCESVKQSTLTQQTELLQSIDADYKKLAAVKTVSSMGDELKVSYGTYDGDKNGWNAYLSLYSDGILLFKVTFIIKYEDLAGKPAPDLLTASDKEFGEYMNNTDMYTSLLVRGDPILYFELDYNVIAAGKNEPSKYTFYFTKLTAINTLSGKVVQTRSLNEKLVKTMTPKWDLREMNSVVEEEKLKKSKTVRKNSGITVTETNEERVIEEMETQFVKIPGTNYKMLKTEVTQKLYKEVMGENPSYHEGDDLPVEDVSWYDAIYFCNKLSEILGVEPVYLVDGKTDVTKWNYTPHKRDSIKGKVSQNTKAKGFRLPTYDEWKYAAKGGENYKYAGSDNLDKVGWYAENRDYRTHPVAQKKPNGYGLYDMSGNVCEWGWDFSSGSYRYICGGSYRSSDYNCEVDHGDGFNANDRYYDIGFRLVCPSLK